METSKLAKIVYVSLYSIIPYMYMLAYTSKYLCRPKQDPLYHTSSILLLHGANANIKILRFDGLSIKIEPWYYLLPWWINSNTYTKYIHTFRPSFFEYRQYTNKLKNLDFYSLVL